LTICHMGEIVLIRFCGWWIDFFGTKFYMIPHTWAKGELIFFDLDDFALRTFLYKFVVRISI
jgi:hypothetical protein